MYIKKVYVTSILYQEDYNILLTFWLKERAKEKYMFKKKRMIYIYKLRC